MKKKLKQDIISAFWAGFNQAHYSHLHPDTFPPKEMILAGKEWFEKTYKEEIHIHHSGIVLDKEGDDILDKGYNNSIVYKTIDYKSEVLKVYKNAYHIRDCGGFPTHEIWIPPVKAKRISGLEPDEESAWKSAYQIMKRRKEIK